MVCLYLFVVCLFLRGVALGEVEGRKEYENKALSLCLASFSGGML